VKDVDFDQNQIVVREGKGFKDRVTMLPERLRGPVAEHLKRGALERDYDADLHACDGQAGAGSEEPGGLPVTARRLRVADGRLRVEAESRLSGKPRVEGVRVGFPAPRGRSVVS